MEKMFDDYVVFILAADNFFKAEREAFLNDGNGIDSLYDICIEIAQKFEESEENNDLGISQYEALEKFLHKKDISEWVKSLLKAKILFKEFSVPQKLISIFANDEHIFEGHISEIKNKFTKEKWSKILDMEIKSTNYYFEFFVIRLKGEF